MNDATTDTDGRQAKRQWAFIHFIAAYRAMKKHRTHDSETEAVKALVDCLEAKEPDRDAFGKAYAFLDRLADDEIAAWSELFRNAIEVGPLPQNAWHDLKRCHGDGNLQLVVMTRSLPQARGPEAIVFYGDTRGLLGGFRDGLDLSPTPHHILEDGSNVFFIRNA